MGDTCDILPEDTSDVLSGETGKGDCANENTCVDPALDTGLAGSTDSLRLDLPPQFSFTL